MKKGLISFVDGLELIGDGRTQGFGKVKVGTVPPCVKIGTRAMIPWVEAEVLRRARTASFTEDEQKELVLRLLTARDALAGEDEVLAILTAMQAERRVHGLVGKIDTAAASERGRALIAKRGRGKAVAA